MPAPDNSPSVISVKSNPLETAQELFTIAESFEELLITNFACLEYAFDYMDSATGPRRGRVSMTKFIYCCDMFKFGFTEPRALFSFLDTKADGVLDLEELKGWRSVRTLTIQKLKRPISAASAFSDNVPPCC